MKIINKLVRENDKERKIMNGDVVTFEYSGRKDFGVLVLVKFGELMLIGPTDNFNRWKNETFSATLTVSELKKELGENYRNIEFIPREKVMVTFELI